MLTMAMLAQGVGVWWVFSAGLFAGVALAMGFVFTVGHLQERRDRRPPPGATREDVR